MSSPPPRCSDVPIANDPTSLGLRFGAAGLIFVVSLLASSFPSLAKRSPRIEPPLVTFFVGKHFGTGVILSTAFVHLLQEGFESLIDPCLPGKWKKWTGFIVLSSFLLIFLIEYISTVYVEHLSAADIDAAHSRMVTEYEHEPSNQESPSETSPLVESQVLGSRYSRSISRRSGSSYRWHHRHESPYSHTHKAGPRLSNRQSIISVFLPEHEAETLSRMPSMPSTLEHEEEHSHGHGSAFGGHSHGAALLQGEVSRKTRIIGILVLQLGIMLHSVVIGLTLSVTAGSKFTSLFVAIIFHQMFEGLSLGIRIASLPPGGKITHILPVVLCILFAIAAPVGVCLGVWLLPSVPRAITSNALFEVLGGHAGQSRTAQLSKGLMCTISAGMLIYAAAVEMLAGDFVMDPEMRQNGFWMQVLALGSLVVGVVAMAILGIWS